MKKKHRSVPSKKVLKKKGAKKSRLQKKVRARPPAKSRTRKAAKPAKLLIVRKAHRKVLSATREFEKLLQSAALHPQRYVLRLYVTGSTPRSSRAVLNIRALCDRHLNGRYDLEIIDIYQQPTLASSDQVIAAPTLIRRTPAPLRKVIGDMSDEEQVLMGLELKLQDELNKGIEHPSPGT